MDTVMFYDVCSVYSVLFLNSSYLRVYPTRRFIEPWNLIGNSVDVKKLFDWLISGLDWWQSCRRWVANTISRCGRSIRRNWCVNLRVEDCFHDAWDNVTDSYSIRIYNYIFFTVGGKLNKKYVVRLFTFVCLLICFFVQKFACNSGNLNEKVVYLCLIRFLFVLNSKVYELFVE